MKSQEYITLDETYAAHTYNPIDVVIERGEGAWVYDCLLYTSDAADERSSVDLGGRRIIKTKTSDSR